MSRHKFSKFCTKDKVAIHPTLSEGQMPLSDWRHHNFVYSRLLNRRSRRNPFHGCERRFLNVTLLKMKARYKFRGESDVLVGRSLDESRVGRDRE